MGCWWGPGKGQGEEMAILTVFWCRLMAYRWLTQYIQMRHKNRGVVVATGTGPVVIVYECIFQNSLNTFDFMWKASEAQTVLFRKCLTLWRLNYVSFAAQTSLVSAVITAISLKPSYCMHDTIRKRIQMQCCCNKVMNLWAKRQISVFSLHIKETTAL